MPSTTVYEAYLYLSVDSLEGREPLPDKAGESTLLSRSGGEKGLRGGGAGKKDFESY